MCGSAGAREPKEVGSMGLCRKLLVPLESFLVLDTIKYCYCSHGQNQQSHSSCERAEAIAEGKAIVWKKKHPSPLSIDREGIHVPELLSQLITDRIQIYCWISSLFHTIFGSSSEFISHCCITPRLLSI